MIPHLMNSRRLSSQIRNQVIKLVERSKFSNLAGNIERYKNQVDDAVQSANSEDQDYAADVRTALGELYKPADAPAVRSKIEAMVSEWITDFYLHGRPQTLPRQRLPRPDQSEKEQQPAHRRGQHVPHDPRNGGIGLW